MDIISIGSFPNNLTANATFVLITRNQGTFDHIDGVMGLAFNKLSNGVPTFIDSLKITGVITRRVFGFYINSASFSGFEYGSPASNLQIGGYDLQTYSTSTTFKAVFHVSEAQQWNVSFISCEIDIGIPLAFIFNGIFDSATALTVIPGSAFSMLYYWLVQSQGRLCWIDSDSLLIVCQDKERATLPGLTLVTITGNITGTAENLWHCKSEGCVLLVEEGDEDEWIFGDSFLRTFYTVYDMDNLTISFAPAVVSKSNYGSERVTAIGLLAFLIGFS
jgi:hypothetical protein